MTTTAVTASLRLSSESRELAKFVEANRDLIARAAGPPWSRDSAFIWTIDLSVEHSDSVEEIIDASVEAGARVRALPGLPNETAITAWIIVSTGEEFVGLALSEGLVRKASESKLGFVFSLYRSQ